MRMVHCALAHGLLESTYQACLAHELRCRGVQVIIVNTLVQEMHRVCEAHLLT
jgi:hypothetical protein